MKTITIQLEAEIELEDSESNSMKLVLNNIRLISKLLFLNKTFRNSLRIKNDIQK